MKLGAELISGIKNEFKQFISEKVFIVFTWNRHPKFWLMFIRAKKRGKNKFSPPEKNYHATSSLNKTTYKQKTMNKNKNVSEKL